MATVTQVSPASGSTSYFGLLEFTVNVDPGGPHTVRLYVDGVLNTEQGVQLIVGDNPQSWQPAGWEGFDDWSAHTWSVSVFSYPADELLAASATWTVTKEGLAPAKPTNPTPSDGATGAAFGDLTLSWEDGGGWSSLYDVYIGSGPGSLVLRSEGQGGTAYVANLGELPEGVVYWRIDASFGGETTTGDVWSFDPRPLKAATPDPGHEAVDVVLGLALLNWEAGT